MKQVAFVVAASELEDYKITEVIQELAKRDISAEIVAFDEDTASPDWGKYDLILPTPSLDYTHQYERLLQWVAHLEKTGAALANPGPVIRWNTHKSYLLQLREKGISLPHTGVIQSGSTMEQVVAQTESLGCKELVVKPMVGASGKDTSRVMVDNKIDLENIVKLCKDQELLVQEFIPEILTCGEFSLIFFNGVFSHGVRKFNVTGDFRIQGSYGGQVEQLIVDDEQGHVIKTFAQRALQIAPFQNLLYARVDVTLAKPSQEDSPLTLAGTTPVLMELEVFEPDLFTGGNPAAAKRYAEAIRRRIQENNGQKC